MKTTLAVLFGALVILPVKPAKADFVPGRVRPGMVAEMAATSADGVFERVENAQVSLNYQDGKSQPVSITLTPRGQAPITMRILAIEPSSCGDAYQAQTLDRSSIQTQIRLVDFSRALCERVITNVWEADVIQSDNARGEKSELRLEGNPEPVFVTL